MPGKATVSVQCEQCGKKFLAHQFKRAVGQGRFCSMACRANAVRIPNDERFWARVLQSDGCWLWQGYVGPGGYGVFAVTTPQGSQSRSTAHRFSWELHNGKIPDGMCVLHDCPGGDNRRCVNPAHLWLGTKGDNNRDAHTKGRQPSRKGRTHLQGERHPQARLTDEEVRAIRGSYTFGTRKLIAAQYGVSPYTVYEIGTNRTWKHVQ